MRVLEDPDDRQPARQALKLAHQRLQCPLFLALRTEVRQRVALRGRQRQQVGKKCHILVGWRGAGEQGVEFLQLDGWWIIGCEPRRSTEVVNEREQRTV